MASSGKVWGGFTGAFQFLRRYCWGTRPTPRPAQIGETRKGSFSQKMTSLWKLLGYVFALCYQVAFLVGPWLQWTRLALRGEWEVPLVSSHYAVALVPLAPLVFSVLLLTVLRRLHSSPLWSWKWITPMFVCPVVELGLISGLDPFRLLVAATVFVVVLLSLPVVLSPETLGFDNFKHSMGLIRSAYVVAGKLKTTKKPRPDRPLRGLAVLLKRTAFYGATGVLTVFASFPVLRLLAGSEATSLLLGIEPEPAPDEITYGLFFPVWQMTDLVSLLLLGLAGLRAVDAREPGLVAPVIALPVLYSFHLWFAVYFLGLFEGLVLLACVVLFVGASWFTFLSRKR